MGRACRPGTRAEGSRIARARGLVARLASAVALAAWIGLPATACRRAPAPSASGGSGEGDAGALRVLYSGCDAVLRGPVCVVGPGKMLRLWVEGVEGDPGAQVRGRTESGVVALGVPEAIQGGQRYAVTPPAGARELRIEALAGRASWTLRLAAPEPIAALDEAKKLAASGRTGEAIDRVREAEPQLSARGHARALGLRARLELARDRADDAMAVFRDAIAAAGASGLVSDEVEDSDAYVFMLLQRHRFADARVALAAQPEGDASYPDGAARRTYYEGLLAADLDDPRAAIALFARARDEAARLGFSRLRRNAEQEEALRLMDLGRNEEALALLTSIERADGDGVVPCDRADVLTNVGWAALRLRAADEASAADATTPLLAALAIYEGRCPSPEKHVNVLVDLGFAALAHDPRAARAARAARDWVARARAAAPAPTVRVARDLLELEGRIALEERAFDRALASFRAESTLAEQSSSREGEWQGHLGQGEALEALGRAREAVTEYEAAEGRVDEQTAYIPLDHRDAFFEGRERSARLLVGLLVRRGDAAAALQAARRSRSRVLARLLQGDRLANLTSSERPRWEGALARYRDARDALDAETAEDWRLSARRLEATRAARRAKDVAIRAELDAAFALLEPARPADLPRDPPPPGTLDLAFAPVRGGWAIFTTDAGGPRAKIVGPEAIDGAEALAGALHAPLAAARRVRVYAAGRLRGVDFHALPFDGQPLVAHAAVEYVVDVAPGPRASEARARRALVVADPSGNLHAAREEGRGVARALTAMGVGALTIEGAEATSARVRDALAGVDLLHFAGHSAFSGAGGWDAALLLGNGTRWTAGDVLVLPFVPPQVVLSGCEAAREAVDLAPEGLGLAQAFVVAGARSVIAATRVVDDAMAADLVAEWYRAWGGEAAGDPTAALRLAQLAVRARDPQADWAAFRALRP